MTILTVAQSVTPRISQPSPTALVGSASSLHQELNALIADEARVIAKSDDWQELQTLATVTGDGTTEDFSLPSDFERLLLNGQVFSSEYQTSLQHIKEPDDWLELDIRSYDYVVNAWTIYGDQIHFKPALPSGVLAKYYYNTDKIFTEDGVAVSSYTKDTATFNLSERLLGLGVLWRWRHDKGLPYQENMEDYERELERLKTENGGSSIIKVGRETYTRGADIAYPKAISG